MKLSTSVFSALVALSLSAQAATVTVGNLPGNVPVPISVPGGALLGTSGSVAIGTFAAGTDFNNGAGLAGAFTQFGESISVGFNGLDGLYQNTITATVGGSALSGAQVFTVISDTGSVAGAGHLAVIDHGFTFVDEPGATPNAVITSGGSLLFGTAGQGDVGGNAFDGFVLSPLDGVVPEPSSALLGLLGLSFLAFRRRK